MLTELCQEIRNWFVRSDEDKHLGTFTIKDGAIAAPFLVEGQFYRIAGSIFNDGVHQYGKETENELTDETWEGQIWALAIPKAVQELAAEIEAWRKKYEDPDGPGLSPFQSESFGGYTYSKGSGTGSSGSGNGGWVSAFSSRLNRWRKIL
jgi:hypothetical protein